MEVVDGTVIKDYRTEYAKSGASTCRSCEEKIPKVKEFQDVRGHLLRPDNDFSEPYYVLINY